MQQAEALARRAMAPGKRPAGTTSAAAGSTGSGSGLSKAAIAKLFFVFRRRWALKFRELDEDEHAREIWWRDLNAAGLPDAAVTVGIEACRDWEWPPSVGEFIKICTDPENHGLPSPDAAWREATTLVHPGRNQRDWSHGAVYRATIETGWAFVREGSPAARKVFLRNYQIATRRVVAGEDLAAEIPKALPEQVADLPKRADKRIAAGELEKMRAVLRSGGVS